MTECVVGRNGDFNVRRPHRLPLSQLNRRSCIRYPRTSARCRRDNADASTRAGASIIESPTWRLGYVKPGQQSTGGPRGPEDCQIRRGPAKSRAVRPSPVRWRINSRSNSAMAASSVESSRPCGLDVSHKGSPSDRNTAPALLMRSMRSSSSRVDLPSRSSLVMLTISPGRRDRRSNLQLTANQCAVRANRYFLRRPAW